jgi:HAD superfamily hydrolase (TIGR01549 family)
MHCSEEEFDGISFDLFGTLVDVDKPDNPAEAIATHLAAQGMSVPHDWNAAYMESHLDVPDGRELSLPNHVTAALASRSESLHREEIRDDAKRAVVAAFDTGVRTRTGAVRAVATFAERMPVGVLSNCSVPNLAERVLVKSDIDETAFKAVVTSVGCGWRKPHPRAFEAIACELAVNVNNVLHVGDDPATDGRASTAGATSLLVSAVSLTDFRKCLEERWD